MKEWLVSAGLAVGALALFWALMFPKVGGEDRTALPVSTDDGPQGYLALDRWLAAERVPVAHLHRRYTDLAAAAGGGTGNVLVTTMPHRAPVRRAEQDQLTAWVARGNTLLVMASLDDTPRWAVLNYSGNFQDQLARLTRIKFEVIEEKKAHTDADKVRAAVDAALRETRVTLEPVRTAVGVHPLFDGVETVSTRSDLPASRWQASAMDSAPLLAIARRRDTGDAAVWLAPSGKGAVILSGFATPFSNELIGAAGNSRWLGNILAESLGPGGRVIIDDAHQGIVDYYDPTAFFADPRLHHLLWWIVLVWFAWVVGAPRLRPAASQRPPIDDAAMLRMTARFYAGAITAPTAGARLIEHFFNAIRRRRGLREDGTPSWDWLEAQARVPRAELDELRTYYERSADGRSIDLGRLDALLSTLSGHIA